MRLVQLSVERNMLPLNKTTTMVVRTQKKNPFKSLRTPRLVGKKL